MFKRCKKVDEMSGSAFQSGKKKSNRVQTLPGLAK
jgi:hypothetical protein